MYWFYFILLFYFFILYFVLNCFRTYIATNMNKTFESVDC